MLLSSLWQFLMVYDIVLIFDCFIMYLFFYYCFNRMNIQLKNLHDIFWLSAALGHRNKIIRFIKTAQNKPTVSRSVSNLSGNERQLQWMTY